VGNDYPVSPSGSQSFKFHPLLQLKTIVGRPTNINKSRKPTQVNFMKRKYKGMPDP